MVVAESNGTVIPPQAYSAPAVLAGEAAAVFGRSWVLAGFLDHLAAPNDFLTLDIAGTAVMVHNFGGELRAMHNVCSHRFAPIHCEARGNRHPRCAYHGWTFDRDGVPAGIPGNAEFFGLDRPARERLAVRRFAVAACGRFVFVRLAEDGPTLEAYLGPAAEVLRHLSACFTVPFDQRSLDWAANWKLGVENVLEVYHADCVHPETFRQFAGKGWDCSAFGDHSKGVAGISQASGRWWQGVIDRLGLAVSDRHPADRYEHFLIFPNLAIGVTAGAMMSVQTYEPVDADRCRLNFRLWMAPGSDAGPRASGSDNGLRPSAPDNGLRPSAPDNGLRPSAPNNGLRPLRAAREAVEQRISQFNLTVLDEDRLVCEQVHRGARQVRRPAVLGRNEERILAFHAAWLRRQPMAGIAGSDCA